MPIHKVAGGYQWGNHGTVYPTREGAERQAEAIYASGYREPGSSKKKPRAKKKKP